MSYILATYIGGICSIYRFMDLFREIHGLPPRPRDNPAEARRDAAAEAMLEDAAEARRDPAAQARE